MYIDFERMQREIVIWLDNAEVVLGELDQLKDDTEQSDDDINKFKVLYSVISGRGYSMSSSIMSKNGQIGIISTRKQKPKTRHNSVPYQ